MSNLVGLRRSGAGSNVTVQALPRKKKGQGETRGSPHALQD